MSPSGTNGKATINGCGQIPSTFRYKNKDSTYKVNLHTRSVYLTLEVVDGSRVDWLDRNLQVVIGNDVHHFIAKDLIKHRRVRDPCGGFTEAFNCKLYRKYYLSIDVPALGEEVNKVTIYPPKPLVNGKPFKVESIDFNKVTKILLQAINC
ncbi:MAG: hypothetical protein OQJ89_16740 [Kangiellaceae bacterium]|nr:hypothetical protein [Kangiellaceae bacterium]MCW8999575.1 hypothetical protein [Kangiellaceae bacterium]MCW9018623.1 hypothetical protein [Kangiellaceae bacterium]